MSNKKSTSQEECSIKGVCSPSCNASPCNTLSPALSLQESCNQESHSVVSSLPLISSSPALTQERQEEAKGQQTRQVESVSFDNDDEEDSNPFELPENPLDTSNIPYSNIIGKKEKRKHKRKRQQQLEQELLKNGTPLPNNLQELKIQDMKRNLRQKIIQKNLQRTGYTQRMLKSQIDQDQMAKIRKMQDSPEMNKIKNKVNLNDTNLLKTINTIGKNGDLGRILKAGTESGINPSALLSGNNPTLQNVNASTIQAALSQQNANTQDHVQQEEQEQHTEELSSCQDECNHDACQDSQCNNSDSNKESQ
jgi:hypothetical protein